MSKKFKTYYQQMKRLRNDKKIKCSGNNDKAILVKHGYFNLVNGYKSAFTFSKDASNSHVYMANTRIEHLLEVKAFDDNLRMILFKNISKIEEEVRTLAGYMFDIANDGGKIEWYQTTAYDTDRCDVQNIAVLISDLLKDVQRSKSAYLDHYINNHKVIPTWILVKVINLNTFLTFLFNSKSLVCTELCEIYGIKTSRGYSDYKLLNGSLQFMRKIRNACAHNERVFDITTPGNINASYFCFLPNTYRRSTEGKKRLIDFVIYVRYYVDDNSYYSFIDELYALLCDLKSKIPSSSYDYIRGQMGIRDESHILSLKATRKNIDYAKFA